MQKSELTKPESIFELKDEYAKRYGFKDEDNSEFKSEKGLTENIVREISAMKKEPEWMLNKRLAAYKIFKEKPVPKWGPDLSGIDYDDIYYYVKPGGKKADYWDDVPKEIRNTFDKLGVPESERKFFAGAEAQYDSEVVYHSIKKSLSEKGVIFTDTDTALKEYPELIKKYFGSVIPPSDNKYAALNTAAWSGGSFIYVPKGVKLIMPLQAYFRINAEKSGQFERTLIIADEGAEVVYVEGCTAPIYSNTSLHSAIVEIIVHKNATVKYVTVQNWSKNVYNLVTQRAYAYENSSMTWIDFNIGSKINMKYPSIFLKERGAKGEILSVAIAGEDQIQDSGGKIYHIAPDTTSKLVSKGVSKGNGIASYRGLLHVSKNATNVKSSVRCDSLLIGEGSKANTYPYMEINNNDASVAHEATVSKISDEQMFYLMSRGINEDDAIATIVFGFISDLANVLPLEYSLELKRLIKIDTAGSVG
jgi:Fe-S cluster assembly protein SufB